MVCGTDARRPAAHCGRPAACAAIAALSQRARSVARCRVVPAAECRRFRPHHREHGQPSGQEAVPTISRNAAHRTATSGAQRADATHHVARPRAADAAACNRVGRPRSRRSDPAIRRRLLGFPKGTLRNTLSTIPGRTPMKMYRSIAASLLAAAMASLIYNAPASAQHTTFPPVGGSKSGAPYKVVCPAHNFMVGLRGNAGAIIDNMHVLCAGIRANLNPPPFRKDWTRDPNFFSIGNFIGTSGGGGFLEKTCPVPALVKGIRAQYGLLQQNTSRCLHHHALHSRSVRHTCRTPFRFQLPSPCG